MLGANRGSPASLDAIERVARWTRERFELSPEAAVFVSELACALPGCPPLETVVAFWSEAGLRHHFKVFKRVQQVEQDDLPYRWMKNALVVPEGFDGACC